MTCADRDILNQELDNEISRYRKESWGKEPMHPEPRLVGVEMRSKRIVYEKLQPRARLSAQTNGPIVNYEREQKEFYCPEESVIHSGRRQRAGNWDSQAVSFDVLDQERARPSITAAEKRRMQSKQIQQSTSNNVNVIKPELSL